MSYYDRYFAGESEVANLVGKTVRAIHWSEDCVVFDTDGGLVAYEVFGDCCSTSYFHDFFGVEHLLANGAVTEAASVDLHESDPRFKVDTDPDAYAVVQVYGYRLTTVHPVFGEVSSVLSFRNSSNGYYGGWMARAALDAVPAGMQTLTADYVGA